MIEFSEGKELGYSAPIESSDVNEWDDLALTELFAEKQLDD